MPNTTPALSLALMRILKVGAPPQARHPRV